MSENFRNYESADEKIKNCYKQQRTNQTFEFVGKCIDKYCKFKRKDNFWNLFDKLSNFIDLSDPDINLSNHYHLYQTAEAIRKDGHPEWLQFIGLIHDLGKILYLNGCDEDGTTIDTQWGIVGDTFITGCQIPDSIVYPEFNNLNPDMNCELFKTQLGIYPPNVGLNNVNCSFGHDEYLYRLLKFNNIKIPTQGLYMIRFHSLYLWHKNDEYSHLENDFDIKMKKWVKLFNKYDLYTKNNNIGNVNKLREYYSKIVGKYIKKELYY